MRSRRLRLVSWCALLGLLLGPSGARAQVASGGQSQRPNRALFGGGVGKTDHQLVLVGSLGVGRDSVSFPDAPDTSLDGDSFFGSGAAGVHYGLTRSLVSIAGDLDSFVRYAPNLVSRTFRSYRGSGTIAATVPLSSRTALGVNASVDAQPLSTLSLFPEIFAAGTVQVPTNYGLQNTYDLFVTDHGGVSLSRSLSRRSAISFGYDYSHSPKATFRSSQLSQGASVRFTRQLTRDLSMRLGYGRYVGRYSAVAGSTATGSTSRNFRNHLIDVGVDYGRALSFSRRTSLSFSTGSAIVSDTVVTRYDLVGDVALTHDIGQDWSTDVTYSRRVDFLGALAQPTFSDSLFASFGGLISRRLSFNSGVGASQGKIGISGPRNGYQALQASTGVTVGLTRSLGLDVSYIYYRYRFDTQNLLPSTFGTRVNRHSAQVSLSLFAPIFHRVGRSANAAR